MQLANTPPLQSTTPGLHPVSIHQTSPLVRGSKHPITAYYSIYRPRNGSQYDTRKHTHFTFISSGNLFSLFWIRTAHK